MYNILIFTDKRFQLLILLKSSMTLYLIRRRCCCTVYFTYFKPRGEKRKTLPSFFLSLHAQNVLPHFFLLSRLASFIVGKKKHNMDRWEKSTHTHCFFLLRTIILWCGGRTGSHGNGSKRHNTCNSIVTFCNNSYPHRDGIIITLVTLLSILLKML